MGKEYCGQISYKNEIYNVYIDKENFIFVEKVTEKNQFSHFNKFKSKSKEDALPLAIQMLDSAFGNS